MRGGRILAVLVAMLATVLALAPIADAKKRKRPNYASVLYVGNNWDGTADVIHPTKFKRLARINIIPDKAEREFEIKLSPDRFAYFLAIRQLVGEGNHQYVDDMFSSHDGRTLFVSRPSFADVVAIDLRTRKIKWRTKVDGYRADHMAISPDGRRLLVSASTAKLVDQIDTRTGKITGRFDSGESPHENNYSRDGKRVYHASIGRVYTPTDAPTTDTSKGDRWFQIVDAKSLKVLERIDMGKKLEEAGYENMSSAVRPMALARGEKYVWFQVSFFHGFVEYNFKRKKVTRVKSLPVTDASPENEEEYLLDSAHHGLSINPKGTKLCVAGTMDNYAAIVHRRNFKHVKLIHGIDKPYWNTNSARGHNCFVSASGADKVVVISYKRERKIAEIPVGDHPQRMRMGRLRYGYLGIKRPAVKRLKP
jgi:DNA-binding beta-propeller fold protein YncE